MADHNGVGRYEVMRSLSVLLGVVGLAASDQAQSFEWMSSLSDADGNISPGESITVTLSVAMAGNNDFVALSATIFDTLNSLGSDLGDITSWSVLNNLADLTGDLTNSDGDNLTGTNAGQLTVFGPFSSDNPINVLEFTWQSNGGFGDVAYGTSTDAAVLWIGATKQTAQPVDASVTEASFGWTVVPTPGTAGLLALSGLALVRRRR
jgi:uncharacterized protein (TIGR03382 family)